MKTGIPRKTRSRARNFSRTVPKASSPTTTARTSASRRAESLSRLRARLHLLLRPALSRVSRLFLRTGFRDQNHGQGKRARAAARRTVLAQMETAGHRHERRDRLLSAHRAKIENHARLPRSARGISQSRRHHHQKFPRHARYRFPVGARAAQCGGGLHFAHHARHGVAQNHGAAHVPARRAARSHPPAVASAGFTWEC